MLALCLRKKFADNLVVHIEDLVDDGRLGIQHYRDKGGIAPGSFLITQVLHTHLSTFACQLCEPPLVN